MADPRGSRRIRPSPFQVIPLVVGVAAVAALWSQAGRVTPTTSAPPMTLSGPTESATTVAPDQGNLVTWAGTLPDGTDYWITSSQFEGSTRRSAAILADLGLAPSLLLGVTGFMPGFNAVGPTEVRDGIVEAPAGAWVISIELSANAIAALGPQAESILAESIRGHTSLFGDPVVDLAWPLRLAAGSEAAQTHYRSFLVRRCNLDSGEVCADDVVAVPMSYERARRTSVNPELQAGRIYEYPPVGEAFEAGPLAPRAQFGQVWSGSEMLIWGGSAPYRSAPLFADGAAFDPAANRWRMLAAAPLGPRNNPLAVWTGREMIVFGSESKEVASYDPARDRWRSIPDLDWVPEPGSSAVFAGGQVVLWSPVIDRAAGLDPTTETWTALEGTGVDVVQGRLLASPVDGVVYAIGRGEYPSCNGLVMARLDSRGSWHHLAAAEMGTTDFADCGSARYSAVVGSRVHVFGGGGRESRFRAYVAEEERWLDLPSPPLHGCESWPGPSVLGSRLLVNGGCDHQAIYDPTSNNWKEVAVPNEVRFNEWLWTGTEALTWGSSTNPAVAIGWRFTP